MQWSVEHFVGKDRRAFYTIVDTLCAAVWNARQTPKQEWAREMTRLADKLKEVQGLLAA